MGYMIIKQVLTCLWWSAWQKTESKTRGFSNYSGRRASPWSRSILQYSRKTDGSQLLPEAGAGTDTWSAGGGCPFRQTGSQSAELTLGSWSIRVNTHRLVRSQKSFKSHAKRVIQMIL